MGWERKYAAYSLDVRFHDYRWPSFNYHLFNDHSNDGAILLNEQQL